MQYHPELALREIAIAVAAQAAELVETGLARHEGDVEARAAEIDALHDDPDSRSLRWSLGVDGEFAEERLRRREIVNFLNRVRQRRGEAPLAD
ncbi:hypothetical protein P0F65_21605 [Sphingomonas sp. I4]